MWMSAIRNDLQTVTGASTIQSVGAYAATILLYAGLEY